MAKVAFSERPTTLFFKDSVTNAALAFAVALHLLLLFGISFESSTTPAQMMQEVADVLSQDNSNKKKADFIAATSQQGSGTLAEKQRLESFDRSPSQDTQVNLTLDIQDSEKKQTAKQYMQSYLRTTLSIEKIDQQNKKEDASKKDNDSQAEEERIMAQIATLEAQFARRQRIYAKSTKIKTLTSAVDAQASADAVYINRFRRRVEQIGNAHYPAAARSQNLKGDVRLMVILTPDGKVKAIRMRQSSGSKLLDEFAKATVRQGAPYGNFTKEMKASELRLIRTWRFTDTDTLTTFAEE